MLCCTSECTVHKLQRKTQLSELDGDYVCSTCRICRFCICDICPAGFTRWFMDRKQTSKTPIRLLEFRHNSWWGDTSLCKKKRNHFVSDLAGWLDKKAVQLVFVQNSDAYTGFHLTFDQCTLNETFGLALLRFAPPLRVRFVRCSFLTPLRQHIRLFEHSVSREKKQHNRTWMSSIAKYLRFPNSLLILMLSYVFHNFRSLKR